MACRLRHPLAGRPRPLARLLAGALALGLALAGCATPPPPPPPSPRTTVVLLPDDDGQVGSLTLRTAQGEQELDEAFHGLTAAGPGAPTASPAAGGQAQLEATHAELLRAQPPRPASFVLHFLLDKTVLTEAAKAQLPAVLAAVRERAPTEITVFGHADASGTKERNLKLSAERAQAIADWLRKQDPTLGVIDVQYFGDAEPVVRSGAGKAEPSNRRAEIMIL